MILICKNCKKEFISDRSTKIFCSMVCCANSKRGKEIIQLKGKRIGRPKNQKEAVCNVCGKKFSYWAGRKSVKYCSKECWNKRNPKVLNECLYCGKEFWSYKHYNKKYCSKKCYSFDLRKLKKGIKSLLWKGGRTKLSQLLRTRVEYSEWRNAIFIRDNYTCQKCGIKSGCGHRIFLHAHHIKSFNEYPKLRYNLNNGITLCKNCHFLEHNRKF